MKIFRDETTTRRKLRVTITTRRRTKAVAEVISDEMEDNTFEAGLMPAIEAILVDTLDVPNCQAITDNPSADPA